MHNSDLLRPCPLWLAYLVFVIAVAGAGKASAQEGKPGEARLDVSFRITLTPDKEAEGFGAVPLANYVSPYGRIWVDNFTGAGCTLGPFESGKIDLRHFWGTFEVSCRSRSSDDKVSLIEWKGKLADGKISGDMWITLLGTAVSREEIVARRKTERERIIKEHSKTIGGLEANTDQIEAHLRAAEAITDLLPAQGRKLHFTFTTTEVVIIPVGIWSDKKQPATQPGATPAASKKE